MSEECRSGDDAADGFANNADAGRPGAERRRRIRAAFDEAVAASPEHRARRLAELAETDSEIAAEVATLLKAVEATDGSAAGLEPRRDRSDPMLGRVLGPPETGWRLESLIGAGGSGRVYRAVRVHDGAIAAVKVLSPARASQAGLARLKSEIAATRRIDHPGVVPVIEAVGDGVTAGDAAAVADAAADPDAASGEKAWIAFELVTGARWITEHALDLPEADVGAVLELVLAVADAVAAAHAAGVVHRDLKPSNLLVGADGRPRVIDFGIARLLDPLGEGSTILAERTREGEILGTPAYMAPEQVDPRLGRVSPRTDVHALGVLAFRLLSGRMPYETGGNLLAAAQAIRHVPPRSLRALAPEVPPAVEAVLMAAMSKEPDGRPAHAGEFARRLRAAMDPAASASAPATAAATPGRTRGVTAVAIVLPVMFMLAWLAGRGGTPEAAGPMATTPATGGHPLRVAFEQPSRPVASGGRTLRVPSQHPTIQAAIDAAVDGDLVLIAPGTYRETLQIGGRSIEVRGEGRAAEVILESPDGGRILSLEGTRTSVAAFRDLSFTGSRSHEAVQVGKAGAIFERCLFRDNASAGLTADPGPETRCDAESVLQFLDCLFLENGSNMGAGVRLIRRSAVFDGCGFIDNLAANRPQDTGRAAGAGLYYSSWYCGGFTLEIRDGVFAGNRAEWGGAIYAEGDLRPADEQSAVRIERTVFFSNDAIEGRIAWPFMVRFSVRDSLLCGDGDLIHDQWIDGGDNRVLAGRGEAPYKDADGDLVPDRLQELLGLSTRARDRIMFEEASHPAVDGRTLRVPGDHETVQAAIDAAADGDLVLIAPGIYRESLETRGKAIELRGEGRAAEVILESPSGGRVLLVSDAAGARPAFRDLTFTGSDRDFAVWVFDAAAVFERCVFRDNPGGGVGDFDSDCDPNPASSYLDCLFLDNAGTEGGGLRVQRRSILVDGCGFVGNRADQPAIAPGRGAGGGLYYSDFECGRTGSRIRDCVFAGNKAQWGGGMYVEGDFVPEGSEPTVTVDRSVFHANIAEEGEAAWTWSVRLELSRSEVCGPGDLFHNEWINAGRNVIRPACLDDPPYDDEDGDLIPDRLQRLLGVPTRPRDRSSFERPSMPAEDGRILRVPGNADSVQAAIDAASDGDLVLLAPGEHLESLDLRGKAIEIRGDGRANDVVLRSPDGGPVLTLASGETPATVFRDLTITGGVGGPAVRLRDAAASFERCIFRDNRGGAVHHAAASGTSEASPAESRYVDCLFLANSADEGGALRIDGRSVRLDGCSFVANRARDVTGGGGAIRFLAMGEGVGGAASLVLRRCGFEANAATRGAAVHAVGSVSGDASHPRLHIDWCFFYPNAVGDGDAVWRSQAGEPVRSIRPEEVPREPGEAVDAVGVDVVMRRSFVCGSPDVVRADRIEAHGNRFDPICDRRGHGHDKDADRIPDVLEQLLGKEIPQLPDP